MTKGTTSNLRARIKSVQRRFASCVDSTITFGDLSLNPETRLVLKSGRKIGLLRQEFKLLQMLLENAGRVLSHNQIKQNLYGYEDVDSNSVEVHIHNLRKKCGADVIITFRGTGYGLRTC